MKANIILFVLLLLGISSFSQQVCVTIIGSPANTQIADIISSSPSVTNTSEQYFQCEQWTYGGVPGESRDLLRFNLSSIPVGAIINSAYLNLYADTSSNNGAMYGTADSSYLLRVTSLWSDSTVTWNTQPTTTTSGEIFLAQSTSANENYLNLNIAPFVQVWVDSPSQNYGIMSQMISQNYYNHMIFCSGYYPDSTLWPTLAICYTLKTTGISAINIDDNPSIFPNPTRGNYFYVHPPNNIDIDMMKVSVYDMLGRAVAIQSTEIQSHLLAVTLDTDTPSGIYLVGLTNGKNQSYQRLILSK